MLLYNLVLADSFLLVRTSSFVSDEELARRLQQEEDDQYTPSPPSSPYRTRSTSPQKRHQMAPLSLRELENAVLERVDRRNEWVANGDGGVGERERDDAPASLKEIMEEEEALHLSRKEYVRARVIGGGICKGSHDWWGVCKGCLDWWGICKGSRDWLGICKGCRD